MKDALKEAVLGLLGSKKALMTLAGMVTILAVKLGLPLDEAQANDVAEYVLYVIGIYVGGQGLADFGKHTPAVQQVNHVVPPPAAADQGGEG